MSNIGVSRGARGLLFRVISSRPTSSPIGIYLPPWKYMPRPGFDSWPHYWVRYSDRPITWWAKQWVFLFFFCDNYLYVLSYGVTTLKLRTHLAEVVMRWVCHLIKSSLSFEAAFKWRLYFQSVFSYVLKDGCQASFLKSLYLWYVCTYCSPLVTPRWVKQPVSFTGVTALCPWARRINPCLVPHKWKVGWALRINLNKSKDKNDLQRKIHNFIWIVQPATPRYIQWTIPSLLYRTRKMKLRGSFGKFLAWHHNSTMRW